MNDIIPAKNYSLHKHRFYAIQKIKYKNLSHPNNENVFKSQFAHFIYNITIP